MAKDEKIVEENTEDKGIKKVLIIVVILIIAIISVSGIFWYNNNKKKQENEKLDIQQSQEKALIEIKEDFMVGKEMSYNELVAKLVDVSEMKEDTKITVKINDASISEGEKYVFDEVGQYKIDVKLEYNQGKSLIVNEKSSEINIIADTEGPVISGISDKTITVGDKIDLKSGIVAEDKIDGILEVTIEGKVDTKKAGKYDIKVIATDKSGNKQEDTFTVTVKEKEKNENNTTNKTTANTTKKTNTTTKTNTTNTTNTTKKTETKKKTLTKAELLSEGRSAKSKNRTQINAVLSYTNKYRKEAGVPNLKLDENLSTAACMRAVEMAYSGNLSHTRPDGTSCFSILSEVGASYGTVGENIAKGQENAKAATGWWRNSPGHYQNMISKDFKKMGVGVFKYNGTYYWVQLFTD